MHGIRPDGLFIWLVLLYHLKGFIIIKIKAQQQSLKEMLSYLVLADVSQAESFLICGVTVIFVDKSNKNRAWSNPVVFIGTRKNS